LSGIKNKLTSAQFQLFGYNTIMRILVVEDEHRIAASLKKGLEQEHYTVDVVYNGIEGYDLASTEGYGLIVLDLMLPGKSGIEICRDLRKNKITTPILVLTAKDQTQDKVLGLDTGADDYLTKPFSFEELLARIRALIRRPVVPIDDILKVEDLSLDTKKFIIKRDQVEIQLSGKEFALLEYLMRHPKQILTKEQIIGHVWNYDSDILPNTIEVYIKNLRSKIDVPFAGKIPLIQTVRGFGYKIG
jgi:two-component system, OmpR family, response regulator